MTADSVRRQLWKSSMIGIPGQENFIGNILTVMGMTRIETNMDQVAVLLASLKIFDDRNNGRYHDLWRQYGAADTLMHLRHKQMRAQQLLAGEVVWPDEGWAPDDLDDLFDAINYGVFTIRNALEGNRGG